MVILPIASDSKLVKEINRIDAQSITAVVINLITNHVHLDFNILKSSEANAARLAGIVRAVCRAEPIFILTIAVNSVIL